VSPERLLEESDWPTGTHLESLWIGGESLIANNLNSKADLAFIVEAFRVERLTSDVGLGCCGATSIAVFERGGSFESFVLKQFGPYRTSVRTNARSACVAASEIEISTLLFAGEPNHMRPFLGRDYIALLIQKLESSYPLNSPGLPISPIQSIKMGYIKRRLRRDENRGRLIY